MSGLGLRVRNFLLFGHPASQESSHVGNAGVGVVSLRGRSPCLAYLCYCSV